MSHEKDFRNILWKIFQMGSNHDAITANNLIEDLVSIMSDAKETKNLNEVPLIRFTWSDRDVQDAGLKIQLIRVIRDASQKFPGANDLCLSLAEAKAIADHGNLFHLSDLVGIGINYNHVRPIANFLRDNGIEFDMGS